MSDTNASMISPTRAVRCVGLALLMLCSGVLAQAPTPDPSDRVARIVDQRGAVAVAPATSEDWIDPMPNRPLTSGDRLWSGRDAMLEVQIGGSTLRLSPLASLDILTLDNDLTTLRLGEGELDLVVHGLDDGQRIAVATPKLAFAIERSGHYRIAVDPRRTDTSVIVIDGAGTAVRGNHTLALGTGTALRFHGNDLRNEPTSTNGDSAFHRYCAERDGRRERTFALRHVGDDVVGYQDLDAHGRWERLPEFGQVWFPNPVAANWVPFRDGHWLWQQPWGWTWIDDQPWGFVTSHYGRWTHANGSWGWVPPPRHLSAVYAPAMVAFIGGRDWSVANAFAGAAPIGWFPLAPGEAYVPPYSASRAYLARVNLHNTSVKDSTISNLYAHIASGQRSLGRRPHANLVLGVALTAVPSDVFVNNRPVRRGVMHLDRRAANTGEIVRDTAIAPSARSRFGTARRSDLRPPFAAIARPVIALRETPLPPVAAVAARAGHAGGVARSSVASLTPSPRAMTLQQRGTPGQVAAARYRNDLE